MQEQEFIGRLTRAVNSITTKIVASHNNANQNFGHSQCDSIVDGGHAGSQHKEYDGRRLQIILDGDNADIFGRLVDEVIASSGREADSKLATTRREAYPNKQHGDDSNRRITLTVKPDKAEEYIEHLESVAAKISSPSAQKGITQLFKIGSIAQNSINKDRLEVNGRQYSTATKFRFSILPDSAKLEGFHHFVQIITNNPALIAALKISGFDQEGGETKSKGDFSLNGKRHVRAMEFTACHPEAILCAINSINEVDRKQKEECLSKT